MHIDNKMNSTKTANTLKKSKKTAVKAGAVPAVAVAPVAAKVVAPEARPTAPIAVKPVAPVAVKAVVPVAAKVVAPEVRPAAPVETKPVTPPKPKVVLELVNPAAKQVAVAGSFNNWQPERTPLKATGNGRWLGDLKVAPGRYEYLFVVDGQWLPDPNARESVQNPFGGRNSVLTVTE